MKKSVVLISITLALTLSSASLFAYANNVEEICKRDSQNTLARSILSGKQEAFSTIDVNKVSELNPADSIIYITGCPTKDYYGYDLFDKVIESADNNNEQSVAIRFTPKQNYQLTTIALWAMNNTTRYHGNIKLSLHEDVITEAGYTLPADEILHAWTIEKISGEFWTPALETVQINDYVELKANKNYWLVASSDAPRHKNPIWNISHSYVQGYVTNTYNGEWQPSRYTAPVSLLISGTPLEQ